MLNPNSQGPPHYYAYILPEWECHYEWDRVLCTSYDFVLFGSDSTMRHAPCKIWWWLVNKKSMSLLNKFSYDLLKYCQFLVNEQPASVGDVEWLKRMYMMYLSLKNLHKYISIIFPPWCSCVADDFMAHLLGSGDYVCLSGPLQCNHGESTIQIRLGLAIICRMMP